MKRIQLLTFVLLGALILTFRATPTQAVEITQPPEPQVIGGNPVEPGEWPWLVALLWTHVPDAYNAQFCGGALIDDGGALQETRWVLTAAHCLVHGPKVTPSEAIQVLAGQQDLRAATPGQRFDVARIIPHPFFRATGSVVKDDIALLELATPVTGIVSLRIATPADAARFAPGVVASVAGWGDTNELMDPFERKPLAQEVDMPLVSNEQCNGPYNGAITAREICTGQMPEGGVDACLGDSGGPLMVPDGAGGWLHAGVVSNGVGCGWASFPGIYTRTAFYASWIKGILEGTPQLDTTLIGPSAAMDFDLLEWFSVATPGEPFTTTLLVANSGLVRVTNATAQAVVPAGASLLEKSISGGGSYDPSTRTISWSIGDLDPLSTVPLTFEMTAPATFSNGPYSAAATVRSGSSPTLVSATSWLPVVTHIDEPVIVTVAISDKSMVSYNEHFTFNLLVLNVGQGPHATSAPMTLTAKLPATIAGTMLSDGGVLADGSATWELEPVPAGSILVRSVETAIPSPGPGKLDTITKARISDFRLTGKATEVQGLNLAKVIAHGSRTLLPLIQR